MSATITDTAANDSRRGVARNTLVLMIAQVIGMPLSMLVNIVMARHLGPAEYGQFYILSTFATLAFLFVDWGLSAVIPARIANDRTAAGRYLGTALTWMVIASAAITGVLSVIFYLRGEGGPVLISLALVCLGQAMAMLVRCVTDAVRGFERTDVAAYAQVSGQLLTAVLVIPVLFLGGRLDAYLIATAAAWMLVLMVVVWRSLRPVGIGALAVDLSTAKALLQHGSSFLMLSLILYLQPTIDAYFLQKFASQEAIGWHAAARKLINPLVFPVSALIAALYPTLCRLWTHDQDEYKRTARGALRASILITIPIALGCAVFAELGILLFSKEAYGPAQDNLRILSAYVFLLYLSMVLGTCLNAAGKQKVWTMVQLLCIVVTVIVDPLLVPWFQQHAHNGGLGANIATVASEVLMLLAGVLLMPRGIVDRSVLRTGLLATLCGGAMVGTAWLLSSITPWIAAPVSVAAYVAALFATGTLDKEQVAMLRTTMKRRRS